MAMEITEIVGQRVKQARRERGLSQDGLGAAVARQLGREDPLPKQMISAVERGKRDLDATELVAFALALGYPVPWFLAPMDVTAGVTLRGQRVLIGRLLRTLTLAEQQPGGDVGGLMARYQETLLELAEAAATLGDVARGLAAELGTRAEGAPAEREGGSTTHRVKALEMRDVAEGAEERSEEAPTGAPGRKES